MTRLSDTTATPPPDSDLGRPTLKTIAAATGLAIATVSRALKDAPDIGEDTKRRVRETAALLGYRPNRAGVRLRTGKTNVIALVLSTEADVMNHTSRLIYSIANALRGTAYHMVVMPYFPDQDPLDPIRYIVETESATASS
jgi:LacI family transcriptional regulator